MRIVVWIYDIFGINSEIKNNFTISFENMVDGSSNNISSSNISQIMLSPESLQ